MNQELVQRLSEAQTDQARQAIVLEVSLAVLPDRLRQAVKTAAIPHWFDALFFEALLGDESRDLYDSLIGLSVVELIPGRGYAIHERTRKQLLSSFWQSERDRFIQLSGRAADYCAGQGDASHWQSEAIYHRLISRPERGIADLQALATAWANYEYRSYGEIEHIVNLVEEQIAAGRLSGPGADWTRLWQAKLALIYGRSDLAAAPLARITTMPEVDPLLAAEVAQTRGDMLALAGDKDGMERAWRAAYERYDHLHRGHGRLDASLVEEKMRQHGLLEDEMAATVDAEPANPPSANALQLIDNINAAWIDGVLKASVDEEIDLRLARDSGHPSNLVFHRPQGLDRPVSAGQRLSRLFAAAGDSLLILGAPGSGKTITLLQLLDELLRQARSDGDAFIPLLFNLSSFGSYAKEDNARLVDWLADQAYHQYRLNRQSTRDRMAAGDTFVLLLDGLDEVSNEDNMRERCVDAINHFMLDSPCGLVVCSRIGDYQALQKRLTLANALVLQPLTDSQIASYVDKVEEPQRSAMQQRIQSDWQLKEALRSPLSLSLFRQAIPAKQATLVKEGFVTGKTVEARRQALFSAYVDAVFSQPEVAKVVKDPPLGKDEPRFRGDSQRWLAFMANRMQRAGTSVFFLEELQPDWLPRSLVGRYRGLYGLLLGLFVGLLGGLTFGLSGGMEFLGTGPRGLLVGVLFTAAIGALFVGLGGAVAVRLTTRLQRSWMRFGVGGLLIWLIAGVIYGLLSGLSGLLTSGIEGLIDGLREGLLAGLIGGLLLGLIVWLGISVSIGIASSSINIQLREQIKTSRPTRHRLVSNLMRGALYGLIVGLIFGLVIGMGIGAFASGMSGDGSIEMSVVGFFGIIGGLIGGAIGVIAGALIGGILAFVKSPPVEERPRPGQGIRSSRKNALLITTLAAILFCLPAWILDLRLGAGGFILGLVLVNILAPIFTWFGGLAWLQHWALRFILYRRRWLPWRLVLWLDTMTSIGLMRRVGGGYIFIHRSLLEYFAASEQASSDQQSHFKKI